MTVAKTLLIFTGQLAICGIFLARLWAWRGSERGRNVLNRTRALVAYWMLVILLLAGIALLTWFDLGPVLGISA